MKFHAIYDPTWANAEHSAINVTIDTTEYGAAPFTATPTDSTDYGPVIYQGCIDGVFGEIAEYVPPVIDYVALADAEKAQRLAEATVAIAPLNDAVDLGIATEEEIQSLNEWKAYRVKVNRVDPLKAPDITWPERPNA